MKLNLVLSAFGLGTCAGTRVPEPEKLSDAELMRRYKVLYPKPTKYRTASTAIMEEKLQKGGDEAKAIRRKLLARMGDV